MRRLTAYSSLCIVLATASALAWGQAASSRNSSDKNSSDKAAAKATTTAAATETSSSKPGSVKTDKIARPVNKPGKLKELPGFTAEREAAALLFVRTHHPELADLLEQLKAAHAMQYQQAIRDLFKTSEKLAQTQERNPRRYELDLKAWTLQSRIQVLAARLAMGPNPALETELRATLAEQQKVQLDQLLDERERLTSRIKDLDAQIETSRSEQNQRVDARMDDLLKGIRRSSSKLKKGADGRNGDAGKKDPGVDGLPPAAATTVVKSDVGR